MGEEFARIMTWPFDKQLFPEKQDPAPQQTIPSGQLTEDEAQTESSKRLARIGKYFTSVSGDTSPVSTAHQKVFS